MDTNSGRGSQRQDRPRAEISPVRRTFSQVAAHSGPFRVLVVEDESLLRWAISETLRDSGHSVLEASDAATAVRALSRASGGIDVVLLDYRLPDSSDLALLEKIRSLSPSSAVVMMTAHATPEWAAAAAALGAHDILIKPFEMGSLEGELLKACSAHA
jgi:DNA-binding NtrC family response regulator